MADYELLDQNGQPRYITKRVRYFDNQLLVDQDFIDDQRHHIDRQRRHARHLHIAGICEGLMVSAGMGASVFVAPGTAVDGLGRQILLDASTQYTVTRDGELLLYIRFKEEESDLTSKDTGAVGNSRFQVRPEIDAVEATSLPAHAVVLATVKLTLEGVEISTAGRAYSGVLLPGPEGSSPPTLRSGGDAAPTTAVLTGALAVSNALSADRLTTRSASTADPLAGVFIDRSSLEHPAGLRFGTNGLARWNLGLTKDGSEHLQLTSEGGPGTLQRWDFQAGSSALAGDLLLDNNSAWLKGEGTVQIPGPSSPADVLVGSNTRFLDLLQTGDELLLSDDATTPTPYRVKEVLSQTELVLTSALNPFTPATAYTFTCRKHSRKLTFAPAQQSMIEFHSGANPGIDKGFVLFKEHSTAFGKTTGPNARLSMGVLGDVGAPEDGGSSGETLDLQGGHLLVLNAGLWDAELELAIGASPQLGSVGGLSFRINNVEKAALTGDGKLNIGAGYTGNTPATLLSVGPTAGFSVNSAGAVLSTALSVGTSANRFVVDSSGAIASATGLKVGTGTTPLVVDANGALTATSLASSGSVSLSGLDAGSSGTAFLRRNANHLVTTTSSVDLGADVSGTLPVLRGGTGITSLTANGLVFASSNSMMASTAALANGILVTSSSSVPSLATTLPTPVQANITQLGNVTTCAGLTASGTLTGPVLNATTEVQTGGISRIDANGNLSNIKEISATGAISATNSVTFSGLSAGSTGTSFVRLGTDKKLATTSSIALNSADVTGTLPVTRGGTGATALTAKGVIYASSATEMGSTGTLASAVLTTSDAGIPTLATTLPPSVQANITQLGTVTACTGLSVSGTLSGATINASTAVQTGGVTRIDATGNLSNIAAITSSGLINTTGALSVSSTVTFSGLSAGVSATSFVRLGTDKKLATTNNIDLSTGDVTGTLPVARGGTGLTTLTANGLVYASDAGALGTTGALASGVLITTDASVPTLASTLPTAVQTNITQLGTVSACGGLTSTGTVKAGTLNSTGNIQTKGATRIDSSGNLSNIGTFSSTGLLSVTNSTSGDGVGGIWIDRSSTAHEANLRFATNGSQRWFLQMDNDATDDLKIWAGGPKFTVHTWDYDTGNQTVRGDLTLESGAISGSWITGVGTIKQGATTSDVTGVGTSFKSILLPGDEIAYGTATAYVKAVLSDTSLTLKSALTTLTTTEAAFNYKKYSRKLSFGRNKTSLVEFHSDVNYGSDRAFIAYKDDSDNFLGTGVENSRFTLGVYNDTGNLVHSDTMDIQGCHMLTLNAGKWDSELDDLIGTQGGTPYGISFRIGNTERMLLNGSGHLRITQTDANECIRITGNTSADSFYTILRNENSSTNGFGILRYNSSGTLTIGAYLDNNGTWTKMSDRTLKENITPLGGALEQVMQLQPVSFDWKASGTHSMGFIAQDVERVFPELVGSMQDNQGRQIKCIAETGLTPVAIAAIQELKQQFEARIACLEARLAASGG